MLNERCKTYYNMTDKPFLTKFKEIIDKTELSEQSKNTYKHRLERLTVFTNKDVDWVLCNCKKTLCLLEKNNITNAETVKGMINAVLCLFKYTKSLKERKPQAYACWVEQFKQVSAKAQEKYEKLEASQKQRDAHVPWADIIKARDELDKKSLEYFILSLYTMIPPVRTDFNKVRLLKAGEDTEDVVKENPNYLVIADGGMKLVLNEYKTKKQVNSTTRQSKRYEQELPLELVTVIQDSLKRQPRTYLVVSAKGEPYHKPNSFTHLVRRVLFSVFKKTMSINTLRHSFINSHDMNKLTPLDKTELGKSLMHGPSTFDRYRFINI